MRGSTNPWKDIRKPKTGALQASRVDPEHPHNPYWARSESGSYLLFFRFELTPCEFRFPKVNGLQIDWFPTDNQFRVTLLRESDWEIFKQICLDLVRSSAHTLSVDSAVEKILARLDRWRKFLSVSRPRLLSFQEILGLIGELEFLRCELLPRLGPMAVKHWNGPSGAPQDFCVNNTCFEVKACSTDNPSMVSISSAEQLSPGALSLYLIVYTLGRGPQGRSLVEQVNSTRDMFVEPVLLECFENRLIDAGYIDQEEYEEERFVIDGPVLYEVKDGFPRLKLESVPIGVVSVRYSIDLLHCNAFRAKLDWEAVCGAE